MMSCLGVSGVPFFASKSSVERLAHAALTAIHWHRTRFAVTPQPRARQAPLICKLCMHMNAAHDWLGDCDAYPFGIPRRHPSTTARTTDGFWTVMAESSGARTRRCPASIMTSTTVSTPDAAD